ncbi:MAG: hypothetical protein A3F42_07680 [Gammaproteobacteria bacterium RIFCSPHIGHO2_12_FULL_37_34]|nr:MAG: hypothetical protein A3F42_07680 [Gammaproteobacteria bacterium RIFCSPHIGHO2_12_FULL_37_34]
MLQSIREHTQGWIAGVIILVIILSFALLGIHSYFIGTPSSNVVAEVNGVEITREQLTVAYERLRRQVQAQYGSNNPTTKDESTLKNRALHALIDIEVLKQASVAEGFRISDRQIDNYLQSMPEFQVDGQFSIERFQEILSSTLLSTSEFLDLIKTSLLIDQPRLGILFTSFALPDETNYTIALVNQVRDIEYINIPLQYFLLQPINISQEKIKAYYDKNQKDFMTPEQVNVEYLELSINDIAAKINPTDTILKTFYNENINSYTQPTAWKLADIIVPIQPDASPAQISYAEDKANELVQALEKGQYFATISRDYPGTLSGEWMTLNQVPAEFQKDVAGLTQSGQFTQPIKTDKGYVIVNAIDFKEPKIQPFADIKNKVKETYVHQHAEEKFAELREQLANTTYEHPDSLAFASKTLGLPIQTSELFAQDKPGKDISQYKKIRDTAFSRDVLEVQNNSDVVQINPETMIVLRVKSHLASALLPLEGISKQIEDKLRTEEAEAQAEKFANNFQAKLSSGMNPEQLANTYGFKWAKTGYIGRYSNKVDPAILDTAFRLPNPAITKNVVYGMTRLPNGYAVIAVKSIESGRVPDQKQFDVFSEQVQNSEGSLEYELYKQSQTSAAKINIQQ